MLGQTLANYSDLRLSLLTLIEYSVCAFFSLHFQMCYQYEKSISRKKKQELHLAIQFSLYYLSSGHLHGVKKKNISNFERWSHTRGSKYSD